LGPPGRRGSAAASVRAPSRLNSRSRATRDCTGPASASPSGVGILGRGTACAARGPDAPKPPPGVGALPATQRPAPAKGGGGYSSCRSSGLPWGRVAREQGGHRIRTLPTGGRWVGRSRRPRGRRRPLRTSSGLVVTTSPRSGTASPPGSLRPRSLCSFASPVCTRRG